MSPVARTPMPIKPSPHLTSSFLRAHFYERLSRAHMQYPIHTSHQLFLIALLKEHNGQGRQRASVLPF